MQRRAEQPLGHVLPGIDGDDARHRQRGAPVDGQDPRMGVRRAPHLEVQQVLDRQVHRVAGLAGQDRGREGVGQAGAERLAGDVRLDVAAAVQGVIDRPVAGAAAQVALQRMGQIRLLFLGQRHRRHDHAGRAEAALEGLRVVEGLLHRMQRAARGEALDRGDLAALAAERGYQAGMERLSVDMDRAGSAIAGVAALLDAEDVEIAEERAQALSGRRLGRIGPAVDLILAHASSRRICSAR